MTKKNQEIENIADRVLANEEFFLGPKYWDLFVNTSKKDLIQYHDSLGRLIRNSFGLWHRPWTPKIKDGVDVSPDHPDAVSMKVIETIWARLNKAKTKTGG